MDSSAPDQTKIVSETQITNKYRFRIHSRSDNHFTNDFSESMLSNQLTPSCQEVALKQLIYPQQILPSTNTSVKVVCLADPTSFYVQLSESCPSVANMSKQLNDVYSGTSF